MGIEAIIAGIGVAVSAVGTIGSMSAAREQSAAARRAEQLRERAMDLDAKRRRQEVIRQQEIARANALSVGTSQSMAEGSALEGAYGSISGATGRNALGITQQQEIGAGIFAANRDAAAASGAAAMWGGLGSLGGMMVKNAGAIDRLGGYFGSQFSTPNFGSPSYSAGGGGSASYNTPLFSGSSSLF